MGYIYILSHLHKLPNGEEDIKRIGAYTSCKEAEKAIKRASKQPGFCECVEGFYIEQYKIDEDHYMKNNS